MSPLSPYMRAGVLFCVFGFHATLCQIVFVREFMVVCRGSELSIAVILGTWLIGITIGAAAGLFPSPTTSGTPFLLGLIALPLALIFPFGVIAIRLLRRFVQLPAGSLMPVEQLVPAAAIIILPAGFLIGFFFPLACRAARSSTGTLPLAAGRETDASSIGTGRRTIARVYSLEAAGSLAAGLGHTFFLVNAMSPLRLSILSAALVVTSAAVMPFTAGSPATGPFAGRSRPGQKPAPAWRLGAFLTALLLFIAGFSGFAGQLQERSIQARWESLHPGMDLLQSVDTPYQNLEVGRLEDQLIFTGNGSIVSAYPDSHTAALEAHWMLNSHRLPADVLLLGGAQAGLLGKMLLDPRVERLVYLEPDPESIRLFSLHARGDDLKMLGDSRLRIVNQDPRHYLRRLAGEDDTSSQRRFDLVSVFVPDPTTAMINRLYTVQFYRDCRHCLKPGGLLLCGVTASSNYLGQEAGDLSRSIFASLRRVFPAVLATGGDTMRFLAAPDSATLEGYGPEQLVTRFTGSGTRDPDFSPYAFHSVIEEDRLRHATDTLSRVRADPDATWINSDWRPVAYLHTLRLWEQFGGGASQLVNGMLRLPIHAIFIGIVLSGFLWAFLPLARRRRSVPEVISRSALITAVSVAGFAGMALELMFIFAFQGLFGYVYQMIGALVALFMFGLALGAWRSGRTAISNGLRHSTEPRNGLDSAIETPGPARDDSPRGSVIPVGWRALTHGLGGLALLGAASPPLLRIMTGTSLLSAAEPLVAGLILVFACAAGFFTGLVVPAAGGAWLSRSTIHRGDAVRTTRVGRTEGAGTARPGTADGAGMERVDTGDSGRTARAAAVVNALDHLGAAVGAILIGLVAFPRLGMSWTGIMVAGLALCCMLRLWTEKRGMGCHCETAPGTPGG